MSKPVNVSLAHIVAHWADSRTDAFTAVSKQVGEQSFKTAVCGTRFLVTAAYKDKYYCTDKFELAPVK